MAQVKYPTGQRVSLRPTQGGLSGHASASPLGGELSHVGGELGEIANKARDDANTVAAQEAQTKYEQFQNDALYNPQHGLLNTEGKNAFGVTDQWQQAAQKQKADIANSLANHVQKQAFEQYANQQDEQVHRQLERHIGHQMEKYDAQTTQDALKTAQNTAALNYNDPETRQEQIGRQVAIIKSRAVRTGMSQVSTQHAIHEAQNQTHAAVLDQMVNHHEYQGAKAYLDHYRKQMDAETAAKAEHTIQHASVRGESQQQSDHIFATHHDETSALATARKISDPNIRDATVRRVKARFGEHRAEVKRYQKKLGESLMTQVDNGTSVDNLDQTKLGQVTEPVRRALTKRERQVAKGQQPVTDYTTYYDLEQRAAADPHKFEQVDLTQYRDKLDDADFKHLSEMQASARGDASKNAIVSVRTKKNIVDAGLAEMGYDPKKNTHQGVIDFRRAVDERIAAQQEDTGKKPTNADIQHIVDDEIVKGNVKGGGLLGTNFDNSQYVFNATPEQLKNMTFDVSDIPQYDRQQITEALQRAGKPVTNDNITGLYQQKLIKDAQ